MDTGIKQEKIEAEGVVWTLVTKLVNKSSSKIKVRPQKRSVIITYSPRASETIKADMVKLIIRLLPRWSGLTKTLKGTLHWREDHYRLTLKECSSFKGKNLYGVKNYTPLCYLAYIPFPGENEFEL